MHIKYSKDTTDQRPRKMARNITIPALAMSAYAVSKVNGNNGGGSDDGSNFGSSNLGSEASTRVLTGTGTLHTPMPIMNSVGGPVDEIINVAGWQFYNGVQYYVSMTMHAQS